MSNINTIDKGQPLFIPDLLGPTIPLGFQSIAQMQPSNPHRLIDSRPLTMRGTIVSKARLPMGQKCMLPHCFQNRCLTLAISHLTSLPNPFLRTQTLFIYDIITGPALPRFAAALRAFPADFSSLFSRLKNWEYPDGHRYHPCKPSHWYR